MTRIQLTAAALLLAAIGSFAQAMNVEERLEVLEQAQANYDSGLLLLQVDPTAAQHDFAAAADGWRRVVATGANNGRVLANLGNAEAQAGRLGHAILAYLQADRALPGNAAIATNLAAARNQVPARFDHGDTIVLYDSVARGWHLLGFDTRWWIAASAWVALWAAVLWRVSRGPTTEGNRLFWRSAITVCAFTSVATGATVALDATANAWSQPGVILQETTARSGNGESFTASFSKTLPAGVEFEVIDTRPNWHHVRFNDGRTAWLRADHVGVH